MGYNNKCSTGYPYREDLQTAMAGKQMFLLTTSLGQCYLMHWVSLTENTDKAERNFDHMSLCFKYVCIWGEELGEKRILFYVIVFFFFSDEWI